MLASRTEKNDSCTRQITVLSLKQGNAEPMNMRQPNSERKQRNSLRLIDSPRRPAYTRSIIRLLNLFVLLGSSLVLLQNPCHAQDPEVTILNATFGEGRGLVNCTDRIRELMVDRDRITTVNGAGLSIGNPRAFRRNQLRINYRVDGKEGIVALDNGMVVNLYDAVIAHSRGEPVTPANAPLGGFQRSVPLAAPISNLCSGANGRLLVCHLPEADQLVVVDLVTAEIVKTLTQPDDIVFAAHQDSLIIGTIGSGQLERWSLTTFELEHSVVFDRTDRMCSLSMGCSGNGPLAVVSDRELSLFDPETLKRIAFPDDSLLPLASGLVNRVSVSADGLNFCSKGHGAPGQSFHLLRLSGRAAWLAESAPYDTPETWTFPSADGDFVFWDGNERVFTADMQPRTTPEFKDEIILPTTSPSYFVAVRPASDAEMNLSIGTLPDFRRTATFTKLPTVFRKNQPLPLQARIDQEPRARFLPDQNRLAIISIDDRTIHVYELDLATAITATGRPHLYVNSKPSLVMAPQQSLNYQLSSLSSSEVTYSLESGPNGLTVTPEGLVSWVAPDSENRFTVSINASNTQQVTASHVFQLEVRRFRELAGATNSSDDSTLSLADWFDQESPSTVSSMTELSLPETIGMIAWGGNGRFLIAQSRSGKVLYVVDSVSKTVVFQIEKETDDLFCANLKNLFVYSKANSSLTGIDLATGQQVSKVVLPRVPNAVQLSAGVNAEGLICLLSANGLQFFDSISLNSVTVTNQELVAGITGTSRPTVHAFPNGTTFCLGTGSVCHWLEIVDGFARVIESRERNGLILESGDPATIVSREHLLENDFTQTSPSAGDDWSLWPTSDPRFLVRAQLPRDRGPVALEQGATVTVVGMADLNPVSDELRIPKFVSAELDNETRIDLFAEGNRLIAVPETNDRVFIFEWQPRSSRDEGQLRFLTRPGRVGKLAESYSYRPLTNSSSSVTFDLTIAPRGMQMSPEGTLHWRPDRLSSAEPQAVSIVATNEEGLSATLDFEITLSHTPATLNQFTALDGRRWSEPRSSQQVLDTSWSELVWVTDGETEATGLIVGSEGWILTSSTLLESGKSLFVVARESESLAGELQATVYAHDPSVQLALLKIDMTFATEPIPIALGSALEEARDLRVLGMPDGNEGIQRPKIEPINVQAALRLGGKRTSWVDDPSVNWIGSPLLDANGRVVGMIVSQPEDERPVICSSKQMIRFLMQNCDVNGIDSHLERQWYTREGDLIMAGPPMRITNSLVEVVDRTEGGVFEILFQAISFEDQEYANLLSTARRNASR